MSWRELRRKESNARRILLTLYAEHRIVFGDAFIKIQGKLLQIISPAQIYYVK